MKGGFRVKQTKNRLISSRTKSTIEHFIVETEIRILFSYYVGKCNSKRVDINFIIISYHNIVFFKKFRSHETLCSNTLWLQNFENKITDTNMHVFTKKNIWWFQITMHKLMFMNGSHSKNNFNCDTIFLLINNFFFMNRFFKWFLVLMKRKLIVNVSYHHYWFWWFKLCMDDAI